MNSPEIKERIQLSILVPPELLEKIDGAAEANHRSRTGEVNVRLEKSFEGEENE